jgi:hypothetical protein
MKIILAIMTLGVYLVAVGTIWMAYEQRIANSGFFISPPSAPIQQFVQPTPKPTPEPKSMDLQICPEPQPGVQLLNVSPSFTVTM